MKKLLLIIPLFMAGLVNAQTPDVVAGYFPYWRTTTNVDFESYNYLYFAFVFPTSTGGIESVAFREAAFENFIAGTNDLDAKRLISVGSTGMPEMATSEESRLRFADTLRKFCRHFNLDGIDMDWEAIDNATDSANFKLLMKDIHETIDSTDLEFVITIGSSEYWLKWYQNEALDYADFLQIMIYDKTGTWASSPYGNHASMDHFKEAEAYWIGRGYTRDQLVMGLPFYGYRFDDESGGLADAVTYGEVINDFPDLTSEDNLLTNEAGYYWFNGASLIREKVRYALDESFKGVFVWEIAQDDPTHELSLTKAMNDEMNGVTNSVFELKRTTNMIYPNPTNGQLNISGTFNLWKLSSLNGDLLSSSNSETVDMSYLVSGVYVLQVDNLYTKVIKD